MRAPDLWFRTSPRRPSSGTAVVAEDAKVTGPSSGPSSSSLAHTTAPCAVMVPDQSVSCCFPAKRCPPVEDHSHRGSPWRTTSSSVQARSQPFCSASFSTSSSQVSMSLRRNLPPSRHLVACECNGMPASSSMRSGWPDGKSMGDSPRRELHHSSGAFRPCTCHDSALGASSKVGSTLVSGQITQPSLCHAQPSSKRFNSAEVRPSRQCPAMVAGSSAQTAKASGGPLIHPPRHAF